MEWTLRIDGRQIQITGLVVKLESHDMILGREWASDTEILIDCKNRKLVWPDCLPATKSWNKILTTTRKILESGIKNPEHQKDADRRDALMAQDTWRPKAILKRYNTRTTWNMEQKRQYSNMQQALKGSQPKPRARPQNKATPETLNWKPTINICSISAAAFSIQLKRPGNVFFTTSLYELDREIEDRQNKGTEPLDPKVGPLPYETELQWLQRILPEEFKDFADTFSKEASNRLPPHRPYDHKITIDNPKDADELGYAPLYNQSTQELEEVKRYLIENLDKGFIEPSQAPYASPVLFVKKKDGSLRFCIDYRKLNRITRKDRYPLPLIQETLARLARAKVYTKLDIRQAFHRIRINPDSEELTTFRTRYGAYKCKVLPFGLTNGPATYQRYMNDILFDYLDVFCTVYLDDILIYSEDPLEHELHVRMVLQRLKDAGLQADVRKCEFRVTRTKYLGFIISTKGIEVDPEKVAVIKSWKDPSTAKGVQSFLGFCNFYRRFITNYGRIARPLNLLTRKGTLFKWTDECQDAFGQLKEALISAPILRYYEPELPTMVETDASNGVLAGVLSQQDSKSKLWHPVAFFSKTMQPAELNYDIHDKEMLAIIRALEEWRAELEGLQADPFMIYSDHRALEYFMTTKKLSARQARWAEFLSRYHFTLMYRAGKSNERADALSRRTDEVKSQDQVMAEYRTQTLLPAAKIDPRILEDLELTPIALISPAQEGSDQSDTQYDSIQLVDKILTLNREAPELQELRQKAQTEKEDTWQLRDGLLLRLGKLYVPDTMLTPRMPLRTAIIREAHDQPLSGHPGRTKLRRLVQTRYYWPEQGKEIDQYCDNCHTCRRAHVPRDKKPGFLHPLPAPDRPWQHITVDFKKCPESKDGHNMVVIFVDRLGKRPISVPVRDTITARGLAPIFLTQVVRHVGIPDSIISDRGPQFISDFWDEFCKRIGTKVKLSTANHPQTDGQTEIVNQYFDQRLRPYINYYQDDWDKWVAIIDYQQASLWHETTGQSPFLTEKGYEPRTSFDWIQPVEANSAKERLNRTDAKDLIQRLHASWEAARTNMTLAQQRYETQANKHRRAVDFKVNDSVWVSTKDWKCDRPSRKLADQMAGPFKILEQKGHSFKLQLPESMKVHPVFHADKLRKDPQNPLPGQSNPDPPPIQLSGGTEEYEVQQVLAVKLIRNTLKYRIEWKGWDPDPDWYPAASLRNSPLALQRFHQDNPTMPGPPINLPYWLECSTKETDPEPRTDDNKAQKA
jgi:transposase InsO family protein